MAGYFQIITARVQAHQEPTESILQGFLFLQAIYMNYPSSVFSMRREGQIVMVAVLTEVRSFPNVATNQCPTVTTLALEGEPYLLSRPPIGQELPVPLLHLLLFLFVFFSFSSCSSFSLPPHFPLLHTLSLLPPPVKSWVLFLSHPHSVPMGFLPFS